MSGVSARPRLTSYSGILPKGVCEVTQWWEIGIPVAGTIASGFAGAWWGALWQWKNSDRLLTRQFEENQRARAVAENEAAKARAEQFTYDRLQRLTDERRILYANYLRLIDDYREAKQEAANADKAHEALLAGHDGDGYPERYKSSLEDLRATNSRCSALGSELIEKTYRLLFVGSGKIATMALKLRDAMSDPERGQEAERLWTEFLNEARKELEP